jgi:predicted ABC-type ATPase
MSNKHFIVIAGPNGAGKSTTSKRILEEYGIEAFDWDKQVYEHWKRFDYDSNETLIQGCKDASTEEFEKHIATAFKLGENVAYETNLHINSHFIRNSKARELGYTTTLIFFLINSPDICEQRVALRVKDGGHFVDRKTIDYRFEKGLENLNKAILEFDRVIIYNTSIDYNIELAALIIKQKAIAVLPAEFPSSVRPILTNINYL